jgi:hypothetical protein
MISGTFPAYTFFGPDTARFDVVPSQALSPTSTEYLVYNNSYPPYQNQSYPSVGLVAISGTPSLRNVQWSEADIPMALTFPPQAAVQPSGPTIMTDDDRFLSASWQSGILWATGNDECFPSGDSTVRSCARLLQILTGGSTPTLSQSFDLGVSGSYVFYPAVTIDGSGDAFFSLSISSSSLYASAATTFQSVGAPANTVGPIALTQQGFGVYDDCGNTCSPTNPQQGNRWGDYSGAARDPSNPAMIWVTAEYAGSSTNPFDWGTGTAEVYLASPTCGSRASLGQPERNSTPSPRPAFVGPTIVVFIPFMPNGSSC